MGGGLRLIGDDSGAASVVAGGKVTATLHWQATTPEGFGPTGLGATELSLRGASPLAVDVPAALLRRLLGATRAAAAGPDAGAIPWVRPDAELTARAVRASGALLRDARTVAVPRDLPAGPYDLVLRWNGGAPVPLGRVEVQAAPSRPRPQPPQRPVGARLDGVNLAGLDLSGAAKPGATLELTLHWSAESAPDADLSVFVHLVGPDGKIAAQHDGQPCGGTCPTSGWASGDELLDSHPISLPTTLAPGRYRINVGLYDPRSGARLRRVDADADFVALPDLEVPP
jgi:hypothetical protein